MRSVFGVAIEAIGQVGTLVAATLEVHLVGTRRHHAVKVTRVQLDLVKESLTVAHLNGPAHVELGNEMLALGVVDAEALPASVHLATECGGLLRLDFTGPLEIATNELLVDDSLRGISHISLLLKFN